MHWTRYGRQRSVCVDPCPQACAKADRGAVRESTREPSHVHVSTCQRKKKMFTLLDLCVSSLRRGHANLLCIVPILTDDPRRGSVSILFTFSLIPLQFRICSSHCSISQPSRLESSTIPFVEHRCLHRGHFGSRYKSGCCGNASLFQSLLDPFSFLHSICLGIPFPRNVPSLPSLPSGLLLFFCTSARAQLGIAFSGHHLHCWGLAPVALRGHGGEVSVNTLCPASHVDGLP